MRKIEACQIYLLGSGKRKIEPCKIVHHCGKRLPDVTLHSPFAWNHDPFGDNNWQAQLQMWRPLDAHILAYSSSQNPVWLEQPQKLICDWHDYYRIHAPSRYVWADMNTGMRAMKLAWFLALHYSDTCPLPIEFIKTCEELRESHLNFLLDTEKQVFSNHGFMDLHGAMALAHTLPQAQAEKVKAIVNRQLKILLAHQFESSGVHKENSPQYQEFILRYLKRMVSSGWFENRLLMDLAARASDVLQWFYLPDGRLAPIGDTDFIAQPEAVKRPPFAQDAEICNKSGYVVIRPRQNPAKRDSYLFFMCARHSLVHKHSDDMSLFWHEGEDVLIDSGKYAYQPSPQRDYVRSTRAHNTLEVDSCDEYSRGRPRRPLAPLTIVENAERRGELFIAKAHMIIQEHDVSHSRMCAFMPGAWLFVCDTVFSTRPHEYALHWHFPPATQIPAASVNMAAALASGRKLFVYVHSSVNASCKLHVGETSPRLQGFCSSGYGRLIPAPCIEISVGAECWQAATLFALDNEMRLERTWNAAYRVSGGGGSHVLYTGGSAPPALF